MRDPLDNPLIDMFLFHPRPADAGSSRLKGVTDGTVPVAEGVALGYRLYAHEPGQPVIVYFHGNGEVAADHDDFAPLYRATVGASLLVFDYRGYGWSTGRPSAATLLSDTEAIGRAIPEILDKHMLSSGRRIVMGRSLGSACAIHLASLAPENWSALIVESGFARVLPLFARLGLPVIPGAPDPVASLDKVAKLDLPLLVIHGNRDSLIPVSEGQALFDASPSARKTIKRFPGAGHNDLMAYAEEYFEAIRAFLVTTAG
jgi:fermentation-respiration switch protein FrsA (DUF1100 family)